MRDLQDGDEFCNLLAALTTARDELAEKQQNYKPLVVKIAPDISDKQLQVLAERLLQHGVDGVIATNTTIDHTAVEQYPNGDQEGGVSGAPVREKSTHVIRLLREALGPDFPIIGVGGIDSLAHAQEKREAGADLVQIYSGLIYQGPQLARTLAAELK